MVSVWLKKKRELVPVKNLNFSKNKVTYKYKGKKITSSYDKDDSDVELVYTTGLVGTQWETINLDFDVTYKTKHIAESFTSYNFFYSVKKSDVENIDTINVYQNMIPE